MKQKQERLHNLDVYKGICILFIILTHFNWNESQRLRMGFPFWVDMAVPIFMVISGYVYALLDNGLALKEQYSIRRISSKWLRFIVPFFVVYLLEILVHILLRDKITASYLVYGFISGGEGPGSYYTPVMVQFILIIPLIIKVIEKLGGVVLLLVLLQI